MRCILPTFVALVLIFSSARDVMAQERIQALTQELEELARGEASEIASDELERARELIRMAVEAERQGQAATAQSMLSLIPLQLRLIRELVTAAQLERRADELEAQLIERRRARQTAREALDRVLEQLLGRSPLMWEERRDHDQE